MPVVCNDNYPEDIGASSYDVCNCCAQSFEGLPFNEWLDYGQKVSNLTPYNGESMGSSTLVGGFPHQCYDEQDIRCAVCSEDLDEMDNDPDYADTLYY